MEIMRTGFLTCHTPPHKSPVVLRAPGRGTAPHSRQVGWLERFPQEAQGIYTNQSSKPLGNINSLPIHSHKVLS